MRARNLPFLPLVRRRAGTVASTRTAGVLLGTIYQMASGECDVSRAIPGAGRGCGGRERLLKSGFCSPRYFFSVHQRGGAGEGGAPPLRPQTRQEIQGFTAPGGGEALA